MPEVLSARVRQRMGMVLVALLPFAAARVWLDGPRLLWLLLAGSVLALIIEVLALRLAGKSIRVFASDLSVVVTVLLLVLLLPASLPFWQLATALVVAVLFARQAFGGLGGNLFNPAMAGVATVLVLWPETATATFPSEAYALLPAAGGAFLLWRRLAAWQAAVGMALGLALALLVATGFRAEAQPVMSWTLMTLAALFIVTDPVTGCLSGRGRLFFGTGVGLLTVLCSRAGDLAHGLPFAVLAMNAAAPWIDAHTPARLRPQP